MGKRKQITLPDDASAILDGLTADCGIDASAVITQLIRRHHSQIRQLFAINNSTLQPATASVVPMPSYAVEHRSELQQEVAFEQPQSTHQTAGSKLIGFLDD